MAGYAHNPKYSIQLQYTNSLNETSTSRTFSGVNIATDPTTTLRTNGYNYTDVYNFGQLYFGTSPLVESGTAKTNLIKQMQITNVAPDEGGD